MDYEPDQDKMMRLSDAVLSCNDTSVEYAISMLNDDDIRIRGEAFYTMMLIDRDVAPILEQHLSNPARYIRAFCSLILANRGDVGSAPHIVPLLNDDSSLVRSCSLGALGHMRYAPATHMAEELLDDKNKEVRISARQAITDMNKPP